MELTGDICDVTPFLDSYAPVNEIPLARCGTVWTDPSSGGEYLLVANQMLWFGSSLSHSLLNPNQLRTYGIDVDDNPFSHEHEFGIDADKAFIPFDMTGAIVYFQTRTPMDAELRNLPVILLTGETWDPSDDLIYPHKWTREYQEMQTIHSLTSGMTR